MQSVVILSVILLSVVMLCRYAEYLMRYVVMLSNVMLSVDFLQR